MSKVIEDMLRPEFNWDLYSDGYNGGCSCVVNTSIRTSGKDKVYSHNYYAQELYDMMNEHMNGFYKAKDVFEGAVYKVVGISVVNDHEIIVDSDSGISSIIDLNKEIQFLKLIGFTNVAAFVFNLNDDLFKMKLINNDLRVKIVGNNRASIYEGARSKVEEEFTNQLNNITAGYVAHVLDINNGGYTVEISGVNCFLPGSLASAGQINDFDSLIGEDIPVCIVNYSKQTNNFVVSHKKYLEMTLPSRVREELTVGQEVFVKVTGTSKNGIFCIIRDKNGVYLFPSLMHRSTMSLDAEKSFDNKEYIKEDEFYAYIHKIVWDESNGTFRIVIGDKAAVIKKEIEER